MTRHCARPVTALSAFSRALNSTGTRMLSCGIVRDLLAFFGASRRAAGATTILESLRLSGIVGCAGAARLRCAHSGAHRTRADICGSTPVSSVEDCGARTGPRPHVFSWLGRAGRGTDCDSGVPPWLCRGSQTDTSRSQTAAADPLSEIVCHEVWSPWRCGCMMRLRDRRIHDSNSRSPPQRTHRPAQAFTQRPSRHRSAVQLAPPRRGCSPATRSI